MPVTTRDGARRRLAGYAHLLRAAERLQWDDAEYDLASEAAAFAALDPSLRGPLRHLLGGFCVAEAAVAEHLAPFEAAAEDPELAECFARQAVDEARHARFFARAWHELAAPGDARAAAGPDLCALFEVELPRRAAALAAGGPLIGAVGLYHLVLEGVAFLIGQAALLSFLEEAGTLPVLTAGARRVQADERWHLGLGVACLSRSGGDDLDIEAATDLALRCWSPEVRARADLDMVRAGHLRRLAFGAAADTPRPGSARGLLSLERAEQR
jgi:ribonucleoside-diphosphate reductase beta chain